MTPIRATPDVTGADAEAIQREIRDGTPNTPQRIETMRRADEVYSRYADDVTLDEAQDFCCALDDEGKKQHQLGDVQTWAPSVFMAALTTFLRQRRNRRSETAGLPPKSESGE